MKFLYRLVIFSIIFILPMRYANGETREGAEMVERSLNENLKTEVVSSLIDPERLHDWIRNGNKTPDNRSIVLVDVIADKGVGLIPNSVVVSYSNFGELRSDGPGAIRGMIPNGKQIDNTLMLAGVDKDSVIVLVGAWKLGDLKPDGTPKNSYNNRVKFITRVWWILTYWGYTADNLKILDGGNELYASTTGVGLVSSYKEPVNSRFSVKELKTAPEIKDRYRVAIGDVLKDIHNGAYIDNKIDGKTDGKKVLINTLSSLLLADDVLVATSGKIFFGRISGSKQLNNAIPMFKNGKFADEQLLLKHFYSLDDPTDKILPEDKDARIITYCATGTSTSIINFLLQEKVGYRNVAIYDGSLSEWTSMSAYKADKFADYVNLPTKKYLKWSEVNNRFEYKDGTPALGISKLLYSNLNGRERWDTSRFTDYLVFRLDESERPFTEQLTPTYEGDAREINEADKRYR